MASAPSHSPDPRSRTRRRLSPEERRDALVRATVTVVARHGYQQASLARIADAAGVSKGLVWHYFAGGDDLMAQTARAALVRLREAVAADLDLTAPVPDVIRAAVARAADLTRTHGDELAAIDAIVKNLRGTDGSALLGLTEYDETYALQVTLFRRGQEEGALRADLDPHLMAVLYQGVIDTMLTYLQAHGELDPGPYAGSVVDFILDGCSVRT